jgi:hypothetical protein
MGVYLVHRADGTVFTAEYVMQNLVPGLHSVPDQRFLGYFLYAPDNSKARVRNAVSRSTNVSDVPVLSLRYFVNVTSATVEEVQLLRITPVAGLQVSNEAKFRSVLREGTDCNSC